MTSFNVTMPINGKLVPGKIQWSVEIGAQFKSDCGTHCVPVSQEDWEKLLAGLEPSFGVGMKVEF